MPEEELPWFIIIGQDRQGPLTPDDVRYLLNRKRIDGGTLIWQEGMETWTRLREIEAFQPKPRVQEEPEAETAEPQPAPEPAPQEEEPRPPSFLSDPHVQRIAGILAVLGFIGGGLYIFLSEPARPRRSSPTTRNHVNSALCLLPSALCPLPSALCPLPSAFRLLPSASPTLSRARPIRWPGCGPETPVPNGNSYARVPRPSPV